MKLLITTATCDDIYQKGEFLKSRGIAIHMSDRGLAGMKTGVEVGLWIILDSQFDDALHLMRDRNHQVENPLSLEEMVNIERSANESSLNILTKAFFKMGMIALIFIAVVAVAIKFIA